MRGAHLQPIVLLVEDSDDDVFFFRHSLKKSGLACSLFHVSDGSQAINYFNLARADSTAAKTPWPDLVFLDLKLPIFSGFEILSWIREQKLEARLDISVLSGSEQAADVARAMELGATSYLVKPIPVEQLRERLQRWSAKAAPDLAEEQSAQLPR